MQNADDVVTKQKKTEPLPPYKPEELQRIAYAHVDRYYFLPPQAREDAAGAFVLAALEACERARPGPGIRSYQYRAGLWAAGQFVREWKEYRDQMPVSFELVTELHGSDDIDDETAKVMTSALALEERASDPIEEILRSEQSEQLRAAVNQLPIRYRKAIRWRFEDGMSLPQIARRLSVTKERAFKITSRALCMLHEYLPADL